MKLNAIKIRILALLLFSFPFFQNAKAQVNEDSLVIKTILKDDSIFWFGYNNCNMPLMQQYIADDIEFYHDKGGITLGAKDLTSALQKNICGNDSIKIRREVVKGSVNVFTLKNGNIIYGAVISGEHLFYVTEKK
jgi:hypothetical protein